MQFKKADDIINIEDRQQEVTKEIVDYEDYCFSAERDTVSWCTFVLDTISYLMCISHFISRSACEEESEERM